MSRKIRKKQRKEFHKRQNKAVETAVNFEFLNAPDYKPESVIYIDNDALPNWLDGNNSVFIDERVKSLPNLTKHLVRAGFNLYTAYRLCGIIDNKMVMIAHRNIDTLGHYLCIGIPIAYIIPKEISKANRYSYLGISKFCPWCNKNYMKAHTDGVICDWDGKHTLTFTEKSAYSIATLTVNNYCELHNKTTNNGISDTNGFYYSNGIRCEYKSNKKFIDDVDRFYRLRLFI